MASAGKAGRELPKGGCSWWGQSSLCPSSVGLDLAGQDWGSSWHCVSQGWVLAGSCVSDQIPEALVMTQNVCNALVQLLLQMNPYHVDSLLQLSDVCRMQEDQEMARDLIGKPEVRSRCVRVQSFPGRLWGGPGKGRGGQELGFPWTILNPTIVPFSTRSVI